MRILVDAIHMVHNMKGVGLYVSNTLKQILAINSNIFFSALIIQGTPIHILPQDKNIEYKYVPWKNHLWHGFWTLPLWAGKLNPDIIWIPYEIPCARIKKPYLIVCHDVPKRIRAAQKQIEKQSSLKERCIDWVDNMLLPGTLKGAEIVFSNSLYVADWLEKEVKVDSSKIRLAPCAPGADFASLSKNVDVVKVRQNLRSPDGYILTFYTGDPRENFSIVPPVYQRIVDAGLIQTLVIAGVKEIVRSGVESLLSHYPWRDRVRIVPFLGTERAQELADIYTAALVYLDPSLQEGFGMQVIEAMACRTPVVCSNRGALPEVTGDAAILVDPENINEIALSVIKVLTDKTVSDQLTLLGYERSRNFSWEYTANVIHKSLVDIAKAII